MDFWWTRLRIAFIPDAIHRTKYIKKNDIFAGVGDNFFFQPRFIPQDSQFVKFGDNVSVASGVTFCTHDVIQKVLNYVPVEKKNNKFKKHYACIEIKNNVFIGCNSIIMGNVRVGNNVIIAAGSVVTHDIPNNVVVAGVPAKIIGDFFDFYNRRKKENIDSNFIENDRERANYCWSQFYKEREKDDGKN